MYIRRYIYKIAQSTSSVRKQQSSMVGLLSRIRRQQKRKKVHPRCDMFHMNVNVARINA